MSRWLLRLEAEFRKEAETGVSASLGLLTRPTQVAASLELASVGQTVEDIEIGASSSVSFVWTDRCNFEYRTALGPTHRSTLGQIARFGFGVRCRLGRFALIGLRREKPPPVIRQTPNSRNAHHPIRLIQANQSECFHADGT